MARLTLDQINQMTPDMAGYLQALGYSVGGETDDGMARYMDSEGNWVSPDVSRDLFSNDALSSYAADQRRMQGVIDINDYLRPGMVDKFAEKGYNSPEAYLSQLYGGGDRVGDYFVLPEAQDVRSAEMVGTPIVYDSPGLFKEFITNAALLAGAGYGLNALTTGGFGGLGGAGAAEAGAGAADAAWGVNAAGTGTGTAAGTAAGEFGLSGATAGNLAGTGGLSSTAGGVTGLTAGGGLGLTVPATATAATSGALLTPAMLASMGLPAATSLGAGSALTAAQQMGGVADPAWGVNALNSALGPLSNFLPDGNSTSNLLSTLGQTLLGGYAANQQSGAYSDLANQFLGMGQPYRDRLNATYDPNWSFANTPDMQRSSQAAMDQAARALSTKFGNPAESPSAIGELLKYGIDNNLSKSFDYRNQLGQFGGLGAAPVAAGANSGLLGVKAQGGLYESLGSGFENLMNPYKLNNGSFL